MYTKSLKFWVCEEILRSCDEQPLWILKYKLFNVSKSY